LELLVDGHRPGDVIEVEPGQTLSVSVGCEGTGVQSLQLVGPQGVVVRTEASPSLTAGIETSICVARSMWLCAVARGPWHAAALGPVVFAHTSPVYVEVPGHPLDSAASARWLLDWLARLDQMVRSHGHFAHESQRNELSAVIERARAYYQARAA
jgi:hypothetical protein